MEAKLIKHGHSYALLIDGKMVAFAHPEDFSNDHMIGKLSLKNCEDIKCGFNLDELAEDLISKKINYTDFDLKDLFKEYFKSGFQKALEILGDKKFTEDDVGKACSLIFLTLGDGGDITTDEIIQSLQQTEWDCIVEMEYINIGAVSSYCHPKDFETEIPKLDAYGCLILKRK